MMSIRISVRLCISVVAITLVLWLHSSRCCAEQELSASERPNLILIVLNDVGSGDLGCYGNRFVETPNLDRMYKNAIRLENYHSYPASAMTWAALLTGRFPERTGVRRDFGGQQLPRSNEPLAAELLRKAGYRTAFFGRWPFGDNYPYRPMERGFEQSLVTGAGGLAQAGDGWGNTSVNPRLKYNGKWTPTNGRLTNTIFSAAIGELKKSTDRPAFIVVAPNDPGEPFDVPDELYKKFLAKGVPARQAYFYAQMSVIDTAFGLFLGQLPKATQRPTVLMLTTSNGGIGGAVAGKYPGQKGDLTDGGHRVPFWISYPKKLPKNVSLNNLCAAYDITPTLLQLAGVDVDESLRLDGLGLMSMLLTDGESFKHRYLVLHRHDGERFTPRITSVIMYDQWRLVSGQYLYDLDEDPDQDRDLGPTQPGQKNVMARVYKMWLDEMHDALQLDETDPSEAMDNPIIVGSKATPVVHLSCYDWHGLKALPPNQKQIYLQNMQNGYWLLDIAQAGEYEIRAAVRPMDQPHTVNAAPLPKGALRVLIGSQTKNVPLTGQTAFGSVTFRLEKGRTKLQTWLLNAQTRTVCGAYYVSIIKVK